MTTRHDLRPSKMHSSPTSNNDYCSTIQYLFFLCNLDLSLKYKIQKQFTSINPGTKRQLCSLPAPRSLFLFLISLCLSCLLMNLHIGILIAVMAHSVSSCTSQGTASKDWDQLAAPLTSMSLSEAFFNKLSSRLGWAKFCVFLKWIFLYLDSRSFMLQLESWIFPKSLCIPFHLSW